MTKINEVISRLFKSSRLLAAQRSFSQTFSDTSKSLFRNIPRHRLEIQSGSLEQHGKDMKRWLWKPIESTKKNPAEGDLQNQHTLINNSCHVQYAFISFIYIGSLHINVCMMVNRRTASLDLKEHFSSGQASGLTQIELQS